MSLRPDATTRNGPPPTQRQVNSFRTAPNVLTLLRICSIPILLGAVWEHHFALAFGLFLFSACTDAIDGFLARWLRQRSLVGQYLDPAADKLLLSSLFLLFTAMGILAPHIALIVFGRDLGMTISAAIIYTLVKLRDFRPTLLGKANSVSQVISIGLVLLSLVNHRPTIMAARETALNATIFFTVVSGFHYAWVVAKRIDALVDAEMKIQPASIRPLDA